MVFCLFWIDSILDDNILQVKVTSDGLGITKRSKKPAPESGSGLISSIYSWARDGANFVVKQLDEEVERLKTQVEYNILEELDEVEIAALREECLVDFYDVNGIRSGKIQYKQDELGRQFVSFFLKTASSQKKVAKAGVFESTSTDTNMEDEETITTQDYREEMECRLQQQQENFQRAFKVQQDQMNSTAHLLTQLMTKMQVNTEQAEYAKQQHLAQQRNQEEMMPDEAGSS